MNVIITSAGIMRRNSVSGSSLASQEQRQSKGVKFASDIGCLVRNELGQQLAGNSGN